MSVRRRSQFRWLILALLAASVLTACTVSFSGGLIGGGIATVLGFLLILTAGASQTGCAEDANPTPDPDEDAQVGPCLRVAPDATVGPCLSRLPDDGGADAVIGPCLGAPLEPDIGPCLGPLPPEAGVDAGAADVGSAADMGADTAADTGPDQGDEPDIFLGPCLDTPFPEDAGASLERPRSDPGLPTVEEIRTKVLAQGNLPPDVVARLKGRS